MEEIIDSKLITYDRVNFVMTENCSYSCAHCMRGDRRANAISKEVIDTVLSQLIMKGAVNLTGGEPLLQVKKMIYLINKLYEMGNEPRRIEVVTNGSIKPKTLEELIKNLDANDAPIKVMISNDSYHTRERLRLNNGKDNLREIMKEYTEIMDKYGYGPDSFYLERYESYGSKVDAVGRGKNIPGAVVRKRNFDLHKSVTLRGKYIDGSLQVLTDGRIIPEINISWEEADQYYSPEEYSILNKPLERILK